MLTERQFAESVGLSRRTVRAHPCIPRVGSSIGVGAAYPAFMLRDGGLRPDLAFVTLFLLRRVSDLEACDWLVRSNPALGGRSPFDWVEDNGPLERVIDCLPPPTRPGPSPLHAGDQDVSAIRREWLRVRHDGGPRRAIEWEAIAQRATATPPGV